MPIDIKIVMADAKTITTTVFIDKASQEIELTKPAGAISQVIFDPEGKILKDLTEKKVQSSITGTEPESDLIEWTISPNPADNRNAEPQVVVSFSLKKAANVQVIVFDKLGRKIKELASENYVNGTYTKTISLNEFSSGTFLVRLGIDNKYFGKVLMVK
jgi:hypothetical protein